MSPATLCPTEDPLWRMRAYRLATDALSCAWEDARLLERNRATRSIADQLYRAVGSIGANLAEGYSRASGKDRVRLFEYALGSARESVHWYLAAVPVLGMPVARAHLAALTETRRMLLAIIPQERARLIRPAPRGASAVRSP